MAYRCLLLLCHHVRVEPWLSCWGSLSDVAHGTLERFGVVSEGADRAVPERVVVIMAWSSASPTRPRRAFASVVARLGWPFPAGKNQSWEPFRNSNDNLLISTVYIFCNLAVVKTVRCFRTTMMVDDLPFRWLLAVHLSKELLPDFERKSGVLPVVPVYFTVLTFEQFWDQNKWSRRQVWAGSGRGRLSSCRAWCCSPCRWCTSWLPSFFFNTATFQVGSSRNLDFRSSISGLVGYVDK